MQSERGSSIRSLTPPSLTQHTWLSVCESQAGEDTEEMKMDEKGLPCPPCVTRPGNLSAPGLPAVSARAPPT